MAGYGKFKFYTFEGKIKVSIFEDLEIDLGMLFKEDEKEEKVQEERL